MDSDIIQLTLDEAELYYSLLKKIKSTEYPLSDLLPGIIELAHIIHDRQLEKWAKLERGGYYSQSTYNYLEDSIPSYREVYGYYSDKSGLAIDRTESETYELKSSVIELERMISYEKSDNYIKFINPNSITTNDTHICIRVSSVNRCLDLIRDQFSDYLLDVKSKITILKSTDNSELKVNNIDKLESIFSRFHKVALELRDRRKPNPPILMENEYDVQYVLRGLLTLSFDIIKPEEPCPSCCGSYSIIDILLDNEKIAIEVKRLKPDLTSEKLKGQLLKDINDYRKHGMVKKIIFFLYDPDFLISRQEVFIDGIPKNVEGIEIQVYFSPIV